VVVLTAVTSSSSAVTTTTKMTSYDCDDPHGATTSHVEGTDGEETV